MKTKLLLLPAFVISLIFLVGLVSASVSVVTYFEQTDGASLTINNGDNFGLSFSANRDNGESSMSIVVNLLDSNGNLVLNMWSVNTALDRYNNYAVFGPLLYSGPGNYTIRATVTGNSGSTNTYDLALTVLAPTPGNNAPVITSSPATTINEGILFSYQIVATDADNDALTYSLTLAPSWLSVSNTGLVTGTAPDVTSDYSYSVTTQVSDGTDFDSQSFTLLVRDINQSGDTTAPFLTVSSPTKGGVYTSNTLRLSLSVNEPVSRTWFTLLSNLQEVNMTEISANNFEYNLTLANGTYEIIFYSQDLAGNIGQSTLITFAVDTTGTGDTIAPVVAITSPINGTTYNTRDLTVIFNASDLNLDECAYSLNGGVNVTTTCNVPFNITAIERTNTLTVYAADNTGNIGSQTITFNVDTSTSNGSNGSHGNNGVRHVSDTNSEEQYLEQFNHLSTTEDEEVLTAIGAKTSSSGVILAWLAAGVVVLLIALAIFWIRR